DQHEMFVGWASAPKVDRRFLLAAMPLGLVSAAGVSWLNANALDDPGAGAWLTSATHNVTGVLSMHPYPMVRIADPSSSSGVRTVLVVAQGKCTSSLNLKSVSGQTVHASGVLIERRNRQMLEVPPFLQDWLAVVDQRLPDSNLLASPPVETVGWARLAGTIMDSKCFFGVMRPGRGKTHKACASLCIRGGIPPSYWVRTADGRESVMLMTDANGDPMSMDILPLVADPVEADGEIVRVGDLLQFRADAGAFRRI
ncbi:MAG: hypothetical protein HKN14_16790, partial [Marinicaulis sp.]|nr:hypothetical protein [Marinicaulis sp.]